MRSTRPRGKPLLIEAFASWCPACQRSNQTLSSIASLQKHAGIDVIAISVDEDPERVWEVARSWPISAPVFHDSTGQFAKTYGIRTLPTYILIDETGQVLDSHAGTVGAATVRTWLQVAAESAKHPARGPLISSRKRLATEH